MFKCNCFQQVFLLNVQDNFFYLLFQYYLKILKIVNSIVAIKTDLKIVITERSIINTQQRKVGKWKFKY